MIFTSGEAGWRLEVQGGIRGRRREFGGLRAEDDPEDDVEDEVTHAFEDGAPEFRKNARKRRASTVPPPIQNWPTTDI